VDEAIVSVAKGNNVTSVLDVGAGRALTSARFVKVLPDADLRRSSRTSTWRHALGVDLGINVAGSH
jgi:hypothetical protein